MNDIEIDWLLPVTLQCLLKEILLLNYWIELTNSTLMVSHIPAISKPLILCQRNVGSCDIEKSVICLMKLAD